MHSESICRRGNYRITCQNIVFLPPVGAWGQLCARVSAIAKQGIKILTMGGVGGGRIFCFVFTADILLLSTFKGDLKSYLCSPLTFIKLKRLWGRRMAVTSRAVRSKIIGCDLHSFTATRRCDCSPRCCCSILPDRIHSPQRKWTVADCTTSFPKGLCAVKPRGVNLSTFSQTSCLVVGMTQSGFTSEVPIAFWLPNLNFS